MPPPATDRRTVTRFAPSPTGRLHLGHAYSAWFSWVQAQQDGGRFLLRIEDIDQGRCRPEFEDGILEDLAWLGLSWETPVRRQSDHMNDYATALEQLTGRNLIYPCFCTRRDIQREINAAGHAPHLAPSGPDGPLYPGTCRGLDPTEEIRKNRDFHNPMLLEKIVRYFDIDDIASQFPKHLFDPEAISNRRSKDKKKSQSSPRAAEAAPPPA